METKMNIKLNWSNDKLKAFLQEVEGLLNSVDNIGQYRNIAELAEIIRRNITYEVHN